MTERSPAASISGGKRHPQPARETVPVRGSVDHPFDPAGQFKIIIRDARNHMNVRVARLVREIIEAYVKALHFHALRYLIPDGGDHIPYHPLFLNVELVKKAHMAARRNQGMAGRNRLR